MDTPPSLTPRRSFVHQATPLLPTRRSTGAPNQSRGTAVGSPPWKRLGGEGVLACPKQMVKEPTKGGGVVGSNTYWGIRYDDRQVNRGYQTYPTNDGNKTTGLPSSAIMMRFGGSHLRSFFKTEHTHRHAYPSGRVTFLHGDPLGSGDDQGTTAGDRKR